MSPEQIMINSVSASVEMEGLIVTDEYRALCHKLLNNEITMEDYISAIKEMQGIGA